MSLPLGSKALTEIDRDNYNYLTDNNVSQVGWSNARPSFVGRGKPVNNLTQESVTLEDIELINRELPERQKNYIFTNNDIFTGDNVMTDFMFTDSPTTSYDVWVTFIDEGAGYKNSLGYFFYVHDGTDYVILDNSDTNTDDSAGYYRPTVIFPNASSIAGGRLRSDGVLLPGHKRKLKGNLANGKFQNVNLGFFLVPNGWHNHDVSTSIGVRYNNKPILHTYSPFNPNYVPDATGAANNGYQSVLFNYNAGFQYIIGFEDIQRPGGDGDFNDLIVRVETNPIVDIQNTARVVAPTLIQNCLQKTKQGLLLVSPQSIFTNLSNNNIDYCFRRTINFDSTFNRDRYHAIYTGNYLAFPSGRTPTVITQGETSLQVLYPFTANDVNNNILDNNLQLYLLNTDDNRDDETVLDAENSDPNERTQFDKLVLAQRLENDNVLSEDYAVIEKDNSQTPVGETTIKSETNVFPYNTVGSALIWGDPHIKKINGQIITLAKDLGWFTYLETAGLKIEVNFDFFKDHPIPVYNEFSFISQVRLTDTKSNQSILVDTFDRNLPVLEHNTDDNWRQSHHDSIPEPQVQSDFREVDPRTTNQGLRAKYLSLLNFDSEVSVKVYDWKDRCHIWIIFYPGRPDFMNEIYLDKKDLVSLIDQSSSGLLI